MFITDGCKRVLINVRKMNGEDYGCNLARRILFADYEYNEETDYYTVNSVQECIDQVHEWVKDRNKEYTLAGIEAEITVTVNDMNSPFYKELAEIFDNIAKHSNAEFAEDKFKYNGRTYFIDKNKIYNDIGELVDDPTTEQQIKAYLDIE